MVESRPTSSEGENQRPFAWGLQPTRLVGNTGLSTEHSGL
jgi:hypothetical protein